MRRVIIESPYAGDVPTNLAYLQRAIRDAISRGEAPFASHQMYTAALDDATPEERRLGITAGLAWAPAAELIAVYTDLGITDGMRQGIYNATVRGIPIEYRHLDHGPRYCELCDDMGNCKYCHLTGEAGPDA